MTKVTLALKNPILDLNLEPAHDVTALTTPQIKKLKDENPDAGQMEMAKLQYDAAPILTFGEALKNILNRVKPETNEQASDIFAWMRSIKQEMKTGKGELQLEKEEIQELIGLLDKLSKDFIDSIVSGQIYSTLKEAEGKAFAS